MRTPLLLISLILASAVNAKDFLQSLPPQSTVLPGYESVDSIERRLSELPLCPIEGIWQMTDNDGATFAVERSESSTALAPTRLQMVMIRSPWRSIRPGTVIGHLVPTPKRGVYEARLYSDVARRSGLNLPRGFTLKLSDESDLMTIQPFRSPIKFNLLRLLPYMYRRIVTIQDSRPENLDGAVKIFPRQDSHPLTQIYL